MQVKDFNKAQELYDTIVKLDKEIISLDKKGMALANSADEVVTLNLQFPLPDSETKKMKVFQTRIIFPFLECDFFFHLLPRALPPQRLKK